jgi:hypothetical protein
MQFHCISLTYAFTFGNFKSLLQNFGLIWTGSKLANLALGNGET